MRAPSPTLALRARGALAVFTLPGFKTERVSAPVMTPTAARGVLEAVLWKPAIRWRIERIRVLSEIAYVSFRRNEVSRKAPRLAASIIREGGEYPLYFADDDRTQRNTVALRDVDYVIEARFQLTERAGPGDSVAKFVDMFTRRLARGQHFHQPYLGCREFAADVLPADGAPSPISMTRDLGRLLLDVEFHPDGNRPVLFQASLREGILELPSIEQVMSA